MLIDVRKVASQPGDAAIERVLRAVDPTARVSVETSTGLLRVEGLLTQQQAIDALSAAGYPGSNVAPQSGKGSECCGGCS